MLRYVLNILARWSVYMSVIARTPACLRETPIIPQHTATICKPLILLRSVCGMLAFTHPAIIPRAYRILDNQTPKRALERRPADNLTAAGERLNANL